MDFFARGEFVQLEPHVWCGPQPTEDEWRRLTAQAGGKLTVIKLNTTETGDGEDTDSSIAEALYGHIIARCPIRPIETWLEAAPVEEFVKAINIIFTCYQRQVPCFFHCRDGRDRTGVGRKGFRLASGWTEEAADDEAERLGFRGGLIHPRLQDVFDSFKSTAT